MATFRSFLIILVIMTLSCSHSFYAPEPKDTNRQDSLYILHIQDSLHTQDSLVYDFAPLTIGTKWEYLYCYEAPATAAGWTDSSNIRINIISKQIKGNDTLILLNISKERFFKGWLDTSAGFYHDTSIIDLQYTDTVIVTDSSISPAPGYRCEVFPFWKTHGIRNGSLSNIHLGKDSIKTFISGYINIWGNETIYLQDFGLYSKGIVDCCMMGAVWSIKLLSFNDIPIIKDTIFIWF
jgi:hypothetical protein